MTVDKQLWLSAQNIADSEANLTHLWDALFDLELEKNLEIATKPKAKTGGHGDWLDAAPEIYHNVKKGGTGGRKKNVGSLTVCVQLTCNRAHGDSTWKEFGEFSKVLVGFSPVNGSHWTFDGEPDSSGRHTEARSNGLVWEYSAANLKSDSPEGGGKSWFYAILLSKLDGKESVKKLISEPVSSIIDGGKPNAVLKKIEKDLCIPPRNNSVKEN